jgi:phosphohistidine phosphatase
MKLYVMRHGPAVEVSPSGLDADRVLTAQGRERVRQVAKALLAADEAPVAIYSSPYARALSTAEIIAAATNLADRGGFLEVRREIAPGGPMLELLDELRRAKKRRVMFVGHEPDLSSLVVRLLGRAPTQGMLKGMVVGLSLAEHDGSQDGYTWTVKPRFVLDPKSLEMDRNAP